MILFNHPNETKMKDMKIAFPSFFEDDKFYLPKYSQDMQDTVLSPLQLTY